MRGRWRGVLQCQQHRRRKPALCLQHIKRAFYRLLSCRGAGALLRHLPSQSVSLTYLRLKVSLHG